MIVLDKFKNLADIFLPDLKTQLLKYTKINNYFIELIKY